MPRPASKQLFDGADSHGKQSALSPSYRSPRAFHGLNEGISRLERVPLETVGTQELHFSRDVRSVDARYQR